MKHVQVTAFVLIAVLAGTGIARATPTMTTSVPGSAIYFYVNNPEDRGYNCTIVYSYSWDDFGTRKQNADQTRFFAAGHFNGQVLKVTQSSPHVALDSANMSCN